MPAEPALHSRRRFLGLAAAGAGLAVLGGCAGAGAISEARRLTAAPVRIDLAGRTVSTWGYNGTVPGPEIRLRAGQQLRARLENQLPDPSTVHWHGLSIRNDMDGVPSLTQAAVAPGDGFDYEFVVPDAGSFMYHSHVGHQLDRGLYGPLVIEPRREELAYDREYTLMLDDWADGLPALSAEALAAQPGSGEHTHASYGGRAYPLMLINGRPRQDPQVLSARSGDRIRLRVMNVAADTAFDFAVSGHRLTVTHTDGMPVEHIDVDTVRLGMGERYDVLVHAGRRGGAWQVAAVPVGKGGIARAVLRYAGSTGAAPSEVDLPGELAGRRLAYRDLRNAEDAEWSAREGPDREYRLVLANKQIGGQSYPEADPLLVAPGQRVRFTLHNESPMAHPMHLHGHHFQLALPGGRGPLKDTVVVPTGSAATFDMLADNPGRWLFHCHNLFHMMDGMTRLVEYA